MLSEYWVELWDNKTGQLMADYDTLDEALLMIELASYKHGTEWIESTELLLGCGTGEIAIMTAQEILERVHDVNSVLAKNTAQDPQESGAQA